MSGAASPDNMSEFISARRTESLDAPEISKLVNMETEDLFGRINIVNLIEKALLAITLYNESNSILGHAAFFDYPNLPDTDLTDWIDWISENFMKENYTPMNTLFMHYFVAKSDYTHGCSNEIIRMMFNILPDLQFCFLLVPNGVTLDPSLNDIFHPVPKEEASKVSTNLYVCRREDHVPMLHIRNARIEDHDDLMPIFMRQTDMLNKAYGEYFMAELIEAQDDDMKCIVADVDGTAIGFMSICSNLNIDLLSSCFELAPFNGLRFPHPDDFDERRILSVTSVRSGKASATSVASQKSNKSDKADHPEEEAGKEEPAADGSSQDDDDENVDAVSHTSLYDEVIVQSRSSDNFQIVNTPSDLMVEAFADREKGFFDTEEKPIEDAKFPPPPNYLELARMRKKNPATFHGESAAVCIQLFCIDERHEMRSCDFLMKVFELFPDRRYCVITVPHLVPEFPLLQRFVRAVPLRTAIPVTEIKSGTAPELGLARLTRVTPVVTSTLSQELYIFSIVGVLDDLVVRFATKEDEHRIRHLTRTLDLNEKLLQDFEQYTKAGRDDDGMEIQAFVAEISHQLVGVAIIRREEDIEYIRSHYNIEDFIYFNHHRREDHGHLHHFLLNPVFSHYSKNFIKEILRLGNKTCLYYSLYPTYSDPELSHQHTLVTALNDMVSVRARRQIEYSKEILKENAPSERVLKNQEPYALSHINRKLVLEPKVTINARIIVVGASDVGIAFLETFAFCPHLRFNNLILISPHGLPGGIRPCPIREQMRAQSHCYNQSDYAQMGLRTWVNVVCGKMTAIDRRKKQVVVNSTFIVPYDHLILCTGTQYQVTAPTEVDVTNGATNKDIVNSPCRPCVETPPRNIFVINDDHDAATLLAWIEKNIFNTYGKIIVYGRTLDAYCSVKALLTAGIPSNQLVLVEPPLAITGAKISCINNQEIEDALAAGLVNDEIEVHRNCVLASWDAGQDGYEITSATFSTDDKPVTIQCAAMVNYFVKTVDSDTFQAINCPCLVFDRRLVIDGNFHTNDLAIRGAGPLTKFQRIYYSEEWTHSNFNSKEIGYQLASLMLTLFDPTLEPEQEPSNDQLKLILAYRSPKVQGGFLPGDYYYLHMQKPNLEIPLDVYTAQLDYGRELKTGKINSEESGYFRLHINKYCTVETVTCCSKKPFPVSNIMCLYGLHQRYLNNLVSRYYEKMITDLFSTFNYFRESWAMAIFHDRFLDFRDEIRDLLVSRQSADMTPATLEGFIRNLMEDDCMLTEGQKKQLRSRYSSSGTKQCVEQRLLSFLTYNYYHLPMYVKPGMV